MLEGEDEMEPLCCCQYINVDGERKRRQTVTVVDITKLSD